MKITPFNIFDIIKALDETNIVSDKNCDFYQ
jgi:hypothetical protein